MNTRFLTARDMGEMKRAESIQHSIANRKGKPIAGVKHMVCSCGWEGCVGAIPMALTNASLPKQKTKRVYGRSNMFSGRVVLS